LGIAGYQLPCLMVQPFLRELSFVVKFVYDLLLRSFFQTRVVLWYESVCLSNMDAKVAELQG